MGREMYRILQNTENRVLPCMLAVRGAGATLPYWYLEQWSSTQRVGGTKQQRDDLQELHLSGNIDSLGTHWLLTISLRKCTWTLQPKLLQPPQAKCVLLQVPPSCMLPSWAGSPLKLKLVSVSERILSTLGLRAPQEQGLPLEPSLWNSLVSPAPSPKYLAQCMLNLYLSNECTNQ